MRLRAIVLPLALTYATYGYAQAPQAAGPIEDVFSPSQGTSTILYVVPEGTRVAKGQLVCLLDTDRARESLEDQRITTRQAEANYMQARLTREVAEVAVKEYEIGTFKQQLETINGDIALAQADLSRAQDRFEWAKKMAEKKYVSPAQLVSDELSLKKAKFAVEQNETKKRVLEEYTKAKTIKELRAEVEKARSDELAKRATYELEKAREQKRKPQARSVKVLAPVDGIVRLARPTRLVEEGAEVCDGQLLLRIIPDSTGKAVRP
jgi:HlyD family secretion protein